jgi:hypothetical protein
VCSALLLSSRGSIESFKSEAWPVEAFGVIASEGKASLFPFV